MKIIKFRKELRPAIGAIKPVGKSIGFVPTMGALHDGHRALVTRSVAENDVTVVSIFVNPTQFNNAEDLKKYPRHPEQDAGLLKNAGCDIVFAPDADEMYENGETDATFEFDFGGMDKVMEGKCRPGHFNGVVQVVSKLFRLVEPDRAYFGEKDFQQLAIIRRMVEVMAFPVKIVGCPIVREKSGLAMSSRNERLSPAEREKAAGIANVLSESRTFAPQIPPAELIRQVTAAINRVEGLQVEYFDIVDRESLRSVNTWNGDCIGCIAVFCGNVRLIDNITYNY
ncbi:MAG: pantoate--beta-alanine ligase [Prevotellaceae bacterium]|jgi:pantoate--beta-alanine ligase|nr:pantoate--beta-alanine ligase [Prevotellaceae bacterium]